MKSLVTLSSLFTLRRFVCFTWLVTIFRSASKAGLTDCDANTDDEGFNIPPMEDFVNNQYEGKNHVEEVIDDANDQDEEKTPFEKLMDERDHLKAPEVWDGQEACDVAKDMEYTTTHDTDDSVNVDKQNKIVIIAHWIVLFISLWATHYNITAMALDSILNFLNAAFRLCGDIAPVFSTLAFLVPASIYQFYQKQNTKKDNFKKYVVCAKCYSLYDYEESYEIINGKQVSKRCNFIEFPHHTQLSRRKECGQLLMKEIQCKDDSIKLYPYKVFCYRSLENSIKTFLDRPGFADKCTAWRSRTSVPGYFRDVYDGRVWKSFLQYPHIDGTPYLAKKNSYGLLLNVDWFQPYTHSPYSTGAIYCAIFNLPREERYKRENILLLGLMPGPREPDSHQIHKILKPMVDELNTLWAQGFTYMPNTYPKELQQFYCCIMCISCDLPAARKVSGFLSFNARRGCSKCKKEFKKGKIAYTSITILHYCVLNIP
jgi:hypothetical protein